MPATDLERCIENRLDDLARLGFTVKVERIADDVPGGWLNTGWRWQASIWRGSQGIAECGGATAELAVERAVEGARGLGAAL